MLAIPALGNWRQNEEFKVTLSFTEFQASLGHLAPWFKQTNKQAGRSKDKLDIHFIPNVQNLT